MHKIKFWLMASTLLVDCEMSAQRQYWGYSIADVNGPSMIFRVDSNAMNPEFVHAFGSSGIPANFSSPFLASNGLVYGTMNGSGTSSIFSYDPIIDTFMVRAELGIPDFPRYGSNVSLIEGLPGVLYGGTESLPSGSLFKFFTDNDSLALAAIIPNIPGANLIGLRSSLFKASNGKLFATRKYGQTGLAAPSRVIELDPSTDNLDYTLYPYPAEDWSTLNGDFIEHNSRLYSTARTDGFHTLIDEQGNELPDGKGYIYSCSTGTLDHVRHVYFNDTIRNPEGGMVKHPNGSWYGLALNGPGFGNGYGTNVIYSYDVISNSIAYVNKFIPPTPIFTDYVWPGLLLSSNGRFYGAISAGLFEYDLELDTFRLCARFEPGNGRGPNGSMIEICRKPNYKPRPTTSFNVCAGASFFYDLKNENATSVVWRRNGIVVPGQVNQLLQFDAIAESDEGVWTCTLTNECGVTEPPAITITVNPGTFTTTTISGDTLLCGTGDVAVLTGNNGGSWSGPANSAPNGTNTPTASADLPGTYYLQYTQACGLSMSNLLQVVYLDSARAPFMTSFGGGDDSTNLCVGDAFLLGGNSPGPWGDLPTGVWQDGTTTATYTVQDTGLYFITVSNSCNSDTSNTLVVFRPDTIDFPPVFFTDAMGLPADQLLCLGDSVRVNVPFGVMYSLLYEGNSLGGFIDLFNPITIQDAGNYAVIGYDPCQAYYDTTFFSIVVDALPPPTAEIIPDLPQLLGCDQDTATLSSAAPFSYWAWTDAFGEQRTDSTDQLLVDWSIGFYSLYNYNGCGSGPADGIQVIGTPAPTVLYAEAIDTLCFSDALQTLSPGTPPGGTYSGPGVTGNTFNPAAAGIGEHTITYSYSDGNCTGFAQDVIAVDICQAVRGEDVSEGLWISPNPNNGVFVLRIDSPFTLGMAAIHDALGKRIGILQRVVQGNNAMSFSNLTPGMYSLRIELDGLVKVQRFVVTEVK